MTRPPIPDAPRCGACHQPLTRSHIGTWSCTTFGCALSLGATPARPPNPLYARQRPLAPRRKTP